MNLGQTHWHIIRDDGALTMARRLPVRFDLKVVTQLGGGDKLRLARQVRQDMWRALSRLRGFAPVVRIEETDGGGLRVIAGGEVVRGVATQYAENRIREVLDNPANRTRWMRWAA